MREPLPRLQRNPQPLREGRARYAGKAVVHFGVPPRRFWDNVAFT